MFIGIISSVIVILVIMTYMSTSTLVVDAKAVQVAYEKVKFNYPLEQVVVNSVEHLCQNNFAFCKGKEVSGVITLTFADLAGYIPSNFSNYNIVSGTYNNIEIMENHTTIRITQNIPDSKARYIYLHHYKGKQYGVPPKCVVGLKDSATVCDSENVYHDYPTALQTRAALQ